MKFKLLASVSLLIVLSVFANPVYAQNSAAKAVLEYQKEISPDFMKPHLSALSHDSMQGRETGKPGLEKAARYLAGQYDKMGLKAAGDSSTYFQYYELAALKSDSTVFELYKTGGQTDQLVSRSVASSQKTAPFIRSFGGYDTLNGEIVFAGFGINDEGHNIQNLEGMDIENKWVLVFREIPHVVEGDTIIDPGINNRARFSTILNSKGAAGLLVIPSLNKEEFEENASQQQSFYTGYGRMGLKYRQGGSGGFAKGYNLIAPSLAAEILGLEGADAISKLRQEVLDNITDFRASATEYRLEHTPHTSQKTIVTKNVAAYLEGEDPSLRDEAVVLTAHYDHLGVGSPDSTGDAIYNGADDDGSGTVALLNVAHALAEAKKEGLALKRSILFLHVSGEEKGLLGSRYYSDHPIIPIEQTITNINIDMIGRVDQEHEEEGITDYAYIIGSELISSELDSLLKVANSRSGKIILDKKYNDLNDPNQFYRRSDHWNFGRHSIPFIFFFTGVHDDYHRPSDEVGKIQFDKMAKIVRTIFATTVTVANEEKPPAVDNQEFIEITRSQ